MIKTALVTLLLSAAAATVSGATPEGWRLVWSDEFDTDGKLNPEYWNYEQGFVRNHELQWYQSDNAVCRDGCLVIEARREKRKNPDYDKQSSDWRRTRKNIECTSASVNTRGKFNMHYGRLEVRARIPLADGAWPAIWTLGDSMQWPSCGEIDVMEYYRIKGVPHILANYAWGTDKPYDAKWHSSKTPFSLFTDADPQWGDKFHIWTMDWTPDSITISLDGRQLNTIAVADAVNGNIGHGTTPFSRPQYLLLNLAIGGDNGGPLTRHSLPMKYEIDYVRVYERDNTPQASLSKVAENGWGNTSVNTTVFRNNSVVTHGDTQYVSYYDAAGYLTIAMRRLGTDDWMIHRTQYKGNAKDAHNVISMMVDGEGVLHVSFDHHGHPLRYARGVRPHSPELGPLEPMTGIDEDNVTYPEFYTLKGGDLLFGYRSGSSGRGNLVLNRYDLKNHKWHRVQDILIDGEDERNAYWQMHVDAEGTIHVSWVWRETWLVETNHDLCYARSRDNGVTWERSDGTPYTLPINQANAEYAWRIPQNSELINQTSMSTDNNGNPYIATYWRDADSDVPQYRLVWHDGSRWQSQQVSQRTTPFSLSGGGTKMIPIARPRMVVDNNRIYYIFRDEERGSRVSLAYTDNGANGKWHTTDLTDFAVNAWEPSLDSELWKRDKKLHIFVQPSLQGDGERMVDSAPQPVYILEINK